MNIFRWIIGGFAGLLASGALVCFVVFISTGIDLWVYRARKLGRLTWTLVLFWFNIEIWGRVLWTLIHWSK